MSKSKHINKICIAAIVIALIMAFLLIYASTKGFIWSDNNLGYENRLFNTSSVHTVDIVMDDWDSFISNCENEEYSACTVLIDGEKFGNVGLRAKGNTSLSSVKSMDSQRYSFKIEFDQYETGKSYYGLDKLCLNNLIQDNTMMKDYLAYQMMAGFGVDTPLCSYVYITVNGEDWGLYLAVEGVEDSFLSRNYGSDTGEMYKPDSMSFGGGKGNGKDFDMKKFESEETGETEESGESNKETSSEEARKPDNMSQMPGGFDMGDMPQMPGGFDMGDMPEMPGGFDMGDMPEMPGGFDMGDMPQMPGESNEGDLEVSGNSASGNNKMQMPGGFGMGSDDVKLKYIDDDPDSYSTIFDSAKTDITKQDKTRLIASLKNISEYTDLENTLEMDEVLRYFVVHNFVVNGDSYTGSMIHNYYLHEKDGKLSMIPWDYNLAFGTFQGGNGSNAVNASIDGLVSGGDVNDRPMFGWIFSSDEYTELYHEVYSEFVNEWITNNKLEELISDTYEMIKPYVEKDPTKFCTTEDFETGVKAIEKFVSLRGEAVVRQLSGDDTAVEIGDLNTSDMGSMNNGGGFGGNKSPDSTAKSASGNDAGFSMKPPGEDSDFSRKASENEVDFSMKVPTDGTDFSRKVSGNDVNFPGKNPGDSMDFPNMGFNGDMNRMGNSTSTMGNWLWIAFSALILAIGSVIVIKKK